MQTLDLLTEAIGTIDDATLIINDFHWFLTVDEIAGQWTIKSGEKTIFTADSREAVDAFLYGMALAYKGLPPHLYAKLFSIMAGIDLELDESSVELDVVDGDDERLSDVDIQNYTPSEDVPTDDRFSFD